MWGGGQRLAPAALPQGKTRYPLYRRLGGPQGRSGPHCPRLGVTVVNAIKQIPSEEIINMSADLYLRDSTNGEFVRCKVSEHKLRISRQYLPVEASN
jgi:hypothetical protein